MSERTGLVGHETTVGLHGDLCLALLQLQGTDGDAGDGALLVDLVTELAGDIEVIEVEGQCEGLLQGIQASHIPLVAMTAGQHDIFARIAIW